MWIFTAFGFFSIVRKKPDDEFLTIRARVKSDLDRLRKRLPELSSTKAGGGTDYPFRATAPSEAVAKALSEILREVTYSNFKNESKRILGSRRADILESIWSVATELETLR